MKRAALVLTVLAASATSAHAQRKIVIDPGHGGTDPGGVGTGLQEKNIVLDTSARFRDLLVADSADAAGGGSWTVYMTRDTDVFVSLSARASYANSLGADRFMSIHSNAFGDPSANGTETFSYAEGGQGAALRNLVQEEMIAAWGLRNRGNKTANFAVLRETSMPAVLHELAFITNATDAAKLASPTERQKAAEAHLRAIQRHYGIAPYIPGSMPEPPVDGGVAGVVTGPDGPLAGAAITLDGDHLGGTGADGAFAFDGIAPGEHVVGAALDGYLAADRAVTVEAGARAAADLQLEPSDGGGSEPPMFPSHPIDGDGDGAGMLGGGCTAAGDTAGAGAWLLLALLATRRRRA